MIVSKALKKLSNKHFLSLAGNVSMAFLSIVTYAILYRSLPPTEMGNWVFFQFVFVLLDSFRTGFLQTALIKFYAGANVDRKASIAGSAWYIAIIITLILIIPDIPLWLFLGDITDTGVRLVFDWYAICFICTLPFNIAFWVLQAEERFDKLLILKLINQGTFILFIFILLIFDKIVINTVMYAYITSSLFTSFIAIISGWSKLSYIVKRTNSGIKELYHFGKYSVGTYIGSSLLRSSDSIIIKFMIGPAALATYTLAQRIGEIVEILIRSFIGTAMPAMASAFNNDENDRVIYLMKKYTGMLTLILIPVLIGIFLMADVLVLLLGGAKYLNTEAANVLRIFMSFAILFPIDRFSGITLDIIHKPQLNLIKVILTLIINVVTDIIALSVFGNIYGAATASIFTLLFGVCFGYYSLNKYLPYSFNGIMKLGYLESKLMLSGMIRKKPVL